MGTGSSKPLNEWSSEDLTEGLDTISPKYKAYKESIVENGVDGAFLVSLEENEIDETLDDLGIQNRLHRRILKSKISSLGAIPVRSAPVSPTPTISTTGPMAAMMTGWLRWLVLG